MKVHRWLVGASLVTWLYAGCSEPKRTFEPVGHHGGNGGLGGNSSSTGGASAGESNGGTAGSNDTATGGNESATGGESTTGGGGNETCDADERRCSDDIPEVCGADGSWERAETGCAFGCSNGSCNDCDEGTSACDQSTAKTCVAGHWAYTPCESQCEEGQCVESCEEGKHQCSGLFTVQLCQGGVYVDEKDCPGVCQDGACVGECRPDAVRCQTDSPNTPEVCSAQGAWTAAAVCQKPNGACLEGNCVACAPGAQRCTVLGRPQTCTDFGSWEDQLPCTGDTPACVAGTCKACEPDSKRCDAGRPQLCDASGAWVEQPACSGSTPVCVAATGECGTCRAGDTQCGDDTTVQVCNAGKWVTQMACTGAKPLCSAGECVECSPNSTRCVGSTPQLCSSNSAWVSQAPCAGETPTCIASTGQCGCKEGLAQCHDSNTPEVCSATGTWVQQADCKGDTPVCMNGACQCQENAMDCATANSARVCSNGTWVAQDCDATAPVCVNGRCAECSPNSTRCGSDPNKPSVEVCNADGKWTAQESCYFCSGGKCVNTAGAAGIVGCNSAKGGYCKRPDQYCCYNPSRPSSSVCNSATLKCLSSPIYCDGPSDCADARAPVCCISVTTTNSAASCTDVCTGTVVCDPERPVCPKGTFCHQADAGLPSFFTCQ